MATKLPPDDGRRPNRRMVEQLLRELGDYQFRASKDPKVCELRDKLEQLRDGLENSEPYQSIRKEIIKIEDEIDERNDFIKARVSRVRSKYLANGVTPTVLKELDELVEVLRPYAPPS